MDQFIGTGRRIFGLAWDPSEVGVVNSSEVGEVTTSEVGVVKSSEVGEVTTSEVGVVNSRRWVWLHLSWWCVIILA